MKKNRVFYLSLCSHAILPCRAMSPWSGIYNFDSREPAAPTKGEVRPFQYDSGLLYTEYTSTQLSTKTVCYRLPAHCSLLIAATTHKADNNSIKLNSTGSKRTLDSGTQPKLKTLNQAS